ncbi:MAG: TM2 domain-containing protein [Gemmatimonadota bacterium]
MTPPSDKSRGVAFALAVLLGWAGAHRFYVGKVGTGLLMLCTLGGLGVWYLYDTILVAAGSFRDVDGRRLSRWDVEGTAVPGELTQDMLDEMDHLRREVSELSERVDFAERLLLKSGRQEASDSDPR